MKIAHVLILTSDTKNKTVKKGVSKMVIELGKFKLKECEYLFNEYDLYKDEIAYRVYLNNVEVGTLTKWSDGTMDMFSYKQGVDIQIKELEELEEIENILSWE